MNKIVCAIPKFILYRTVKPYAVKQQSLDFKDSAYRVKWNSNTNSYDSSKKLDAVKNKLGFQISGDDIIIPPGIAMKCRSTYKGEIWYFDVYAKDNKGLKPFKITLITEKLNGLELEEV